MPARRRGRRHAGGDRGGRRVDVADGAGPRPARPPDRCALAAVVGWLHGPWSRWPRPPGCRWSRRRNAIRSRATSVGTGELVGAAIDAGARHVTLGIGGSATTDGGRGLLEGLADGGHRTRRDRRGGRLRCIQPAPRADRRGSDVRTAEGRLPGRCPGTRRAECGLGRRAGDPRGPSTNATRPVPARPAGSGLPSLRRKVGSDRSRCGRGSTS